MVVVKIELWPLGQQDQARLIGCAIITNDGTGNIISGNYDVCLRHSGEYAGKKGIWKQGRVENHKRRLSPYHLVYKALKAALNIRGD